MGQSSSRQLHDEERASLHPHTLQFDEDVRKESAAKLPNFSEGRAVYLRRCSKQYLTLNYHHYYVAAGENFQHIIQFGSASEANDVYKSLVTCNNQQPLGRWHETVENRVVDSAMQHRMNQLLGMKNFSFCLRNSEHVARYIFGQNWTSTQAKEDGVLGSLVALLDQSQKCRLNGFPCSGEVTWDEAGAAYNFLEQPRTATAVEFFHDIPEDSFNVLVIGPTGAGKSHLINVIFNRQILESATSFVSITRDIVFVNGSFTACNEKSKQSETRRIVVADTIGLCDTQWTDDELLIREIQNRVTRNLRYIDCVLLLVYDRLQPRETASVRRVLDWLRYDKVEHRKRIFIIATHAEGVNRHRQSEMTAQAVSLLHLQPVKMSYADGSAVPSVIFLGFPVATDERPLSNAEEDIVRASWDKLNQVLKMPVEQRIDLSDGDSRRWYSPPCTVL